MAGNGKKDVPRATKSQVAAVRRTAKEASQELDREQEESVMGLAEALNEIGEGESFAQLDARVSFMERQVERLQARRDETDRGFQGELSVMRARIEDALEAVGGTAAEQKELGAALERRLTALVSESESGTSDLIETLRRDIVSQVEGATSRLSKAEARLRGETKALSGEVQEQVRAISESVAESQQEIQAVAETLTEQVDAAADEIEQKLSQIAAGVQEQTSATITQHDEEQQVRLAEHSARMQDTAKELRHSIDAIATEAEQLQMRVDQSLLETTNRVDEAIARLAEESSVITSRSDSLAQAISERVTELEVSLQEKSTAAELSLDEKFSQIAQALEEKKSADSEALRTSLDQDLQEQKTDMEGRLGELRAEIRLASQRTKEHVERSIEGAEEATKALHQEVLVKLQDAQERAGNSIIRLEQSVGQHEKRLSAGETEWANETNGLNQELSDLKIRVEELVGRVASYEARTATERGSSQVAVEALVARLDVIERRVREAVEETSAKNATRLEMLSSQVDRMKASEGEAQEHSAGLEYLSKRVGEIAEKLDEALTKVNALGKYVTKRAGLVEGKDTLVMPADVLEKVKEIESKLAGSAEDRASDERLGAMERKVGELIKVVRAIADQPQKLEQRMAALEGAGIPSEIAARLDRLDQAVTNQGPSPEILERLDRLDKAIARPTAPPEVLERLDRAEKAIAQPRVAATSQPSPDLEARIDSLERVISSLSSTISNRQAQLIARMDQIEQAPAPSPNILPQRKKGRW